MEHTGFTLKQQVRNYYIRLTGVRSSSKYLVILYWGSGQLLSNFVIYYQNILTAKSLPGGGEGGPEALNSLFQSTRLKNGHLLGNPVLKLLEFAPNWPIQYESRHVRLSVCLSAPSGAFFFSAYFWP